MNAKSGAMRSAKDIQVLVAVFNDWLQLPIIDMLSSQREDYIRVKSLPELYQRVKEFPRCIVIIDIFTYAEHHQDILKRLYEENPCLSLIPLVSQEKLAYAQCLDRNDSCYIVAKEAVDTQLMPVLACAFKDQRLIADAYAFFQGQKQLPTLSKKEAILMKKEDTPGFVSTDHTGQKKEVIQKVEENQKMLDRKFGRRSFLKGTAAAALAGIVVASPGNLVMKALAEREEKTKPSVAEEIYYSTCNGACEQACRIKIKVRDGKIVQTAMAEYPDPAYNRICSKGLSHVHRIYNPDRLKYPMKRVGERGAGKWERISWEEAIETIGSTWEKLRSQYGESSIAFGGFTGNGGSIGFNAMLKLADTMNSSVFPFCFDKAQRQTTENLLGLGDYFNGNEHADLLNAKCIICWGANPTNSQVQHWHFIADAQKKGAKLIVIDPNYTGAAAKADVFVPLRPGTDAALALAMMNIIVKNNWTDETFLKKSSVGPLLVKQSDGKYLRQSDLGTVIAEGKTDEFIVWDNAGNTYGLLSTIEDPAIRGTYTVNGIKVTTAYELLLTRIEKYPPEKAAEICDIPVETIKKITEMYAKNSPATLYMTYGFDHYVNGHYGYFALVALGIITGNLGKAGATSGYSSGNLTITAFNGKTAVRSSGVAKPRPAIVTQKIPEVMETGQYAGQPLTIKSAYFYSSNFLHAFGSPAMREAFNKMDLIVVADLQMTDTTMYADVILPVAHWFEQEDIMGFYVPFITRTDKAIDPLYECKSDFEIAQLLGKRLGFGSDFNYSVEDSMRLLLDTDHCRGVGVTYEALKEKKTMRGVKPGFVHGEGGKFPTATGRAQFYLEVPKPNYGFGQKIDFDKERLPHFEPPKEAWHENSLIRKYPLQCINEHSKWRTQSQFNHVPWLKELNPEPKVKLNPADAKARGIKAGDIVKVYNDRGYVVIKASLDDGMRPGMVNIAHGWQQDQFIEGHRSDLISLDYNPICINMAFSDTLVEIKKQ